MKKVIIGIIMNAALFVNLAPAIARANNNGNFNEQVILNPYLHDEDAFSPEVRNRINAGSGLNVNYSDRSAAWDAAKESGQFGSEYINSGAREAAEKQKAEAEAKAKADAEKKEAEKKKGQTKTQKILSPDEFEKKNKANCARVHAKQASAGPCLM